MTQGRFVHLHVHTEYSTLDGINKVEELPKYAKSIGQDAVAITDHGNVSGSYRFYKECKKAGVKPIIGMEAYYTVQDRTLKEKDPDGESYYHLVLLAQNGIGLHNLFKLSSKAYTEGMYHKPRLDDALLGEHAEGVMATSACLGSRASQLILKNRTREAEDLILHHAGLFQDRFFIEVQLHSGEQEKVNRELIKIADRHQLPVVLTNDCHYTEEEDKRLHEIALSMQTNTTLSDPKRFSFGDIDVHFANHDWMWERAKALGMSYEAISNTAHVADMVDSASYFSDVRNRYPIFKGLPEGLSPWEALENLSKNLLVEKFGGMPPKHYRDRLDYELRVIKKMGFSDYLLIDWELINGARSVGVWVGPGRGSAAGSLVAYALGITQLDPIKYDLVFERFLNPGRASTPIHFDSEIAKKIDALEG